MAVASFAGTAGADDVRVDADTVFQVYEVRSPGTAAMLARRRFVQTLGVAWARQLADQESAREAVPRLSASLRLRLDQDFGEDCLVARDLCYAATRADAPSFYQPLADDTEVDATEAWVEVSDLPLDTRLRAGRHLLFDAIGLARIDGGSARAEPLPWAAAEAYGGLLVRSTSIAGSDAFVPQGSLQLDLDVPRERAPFVDEPATTWLAGGAVELGHVRWARLRAGFRETRERGDVVARRAALGAASQPVDALRLEATGVWDLVGEQLVDAMAQVSVTPVDELVLRATLERHVPVFDWGTIWAYFDLVPITEARLGATWSVTERLELGAAARGRRADFGGDEDDDNDEDEQDAGGEVHLRARLGSLRLGASAFAWGGDLGPVAALLLDASRPLAPWATAELRVSLWRFDDPLRELLHGTSIAEAAGVRFRLSDTTTVRVELEHAHSRVVGNRFRALAALSLEVWR